MGPQTYDAARLTGDGFPLDAVGQSRLWLAGWLAMRLMTIVDDGGALRPVAQVSFFGV